MNRTTPLRLLREYASGAALNAAESRSLCTAEFNPIEGLVSHFLDGQLRIGLAVGVLAALIERVEQGVLGGILVGDASEYGTLSMLAKSSESLAMPPSELLLGKSTPGAAFTAIPNDAQVCACNNVSKAQICDAIRSKNLCSVDEIKVCTKAGTGCGGCLPLVIDLFKAHIKATGKKLNNALCEHFSCTRPELFEIIKIKRIRTYDEVLASHGRGNGCEICKPAVASILASLWNESVVEQTTIQDTNDRFLANIQRGGTYSVVPRVPGGEITPQKLIALGTVARKFGLYAKITGAQRVDLFGAAEAQSKDFGIIAVDKGWNLYVCGNGGAKQRHAELLAAEIDADTCIKYIDRFLMYYTQTADRLTRTSVWLEKMEGGIDYLKNVIVHDSLGICDELERQMQYVVDTYHCEWAEVVNDPEKRRLFQQFINTDETEPTIEFVKEREQQHPGPWGASFVPLSELMLRQADKEEPADRQLAASEPLAEPEPTERWVQVGKTWNFPKDGGATIKYGKTQIAVFNFASRGEWYATQNMCPHKREFVLSRGMIGDASGKPKVACPVHKKTYSLETGKGMSDKDLSIEVFAVKVDGDDVYLQLPSIEDLDQRLATEKTCTGACHPSDSANGKPKHTLPVRKAKAGDPLMVGAAEDRV